MNKLFLFLLLTILHSACQHKNIQQTGEPELRENEVEPLYVKDVLASIPALKIGNVQSKIVEQSIKCTGRIDIPHFELFALHSRSAGMLESMRYIPGDFVKKGGLLFKISNPEFIEKQRVLLETKAALDLANKEFARKQLLISGDATSQKAMDEAQSKKDLLFASYTGVKSEISLLGINVETLEEKREFQSQIYITAPRSGYIHKVHVNNGQMIGPEDRLMDIANNNHIHLELKVLSKDVSMLQIGQNIKFSLPNNPKMYSAKVEKLNPMIDEETGTLHVHCHIDKMHQKEMVIGMFVNAEIEVESLTMEGLPLDAVVKESGEYFAYVVEGELLKKQLLANVLVFDDFISFRKLSSERMVISGAYYVE